MKNKATGRRVVILNQNGKGNIEQAIFILRQGKDQVGEDYILKEAQKIVDDFVLKNGVKVRNSGINWLIPAGIASGIMIFTCIYFMFMN